MFHPAPALLALLQQTVEAGASDLHLPADAAPVLRINGQLVRVSGAPLSRDDSEHLIRSILAPEQIQKLITTRELDGAIDLENLGRFRFNCHYQRNLLEATFRHIRSHIPTLSELGLPPIVENLCNLRQGLVLVTGPAGVGKSTTLAAMVDLMNRTQKRVIVTLEDPIEYFHTSQSCLIKQREIGSDTLSFTSGIIHALRQDPDVLLVGEMRDLDTISSAITAAETGHLVISTLHTPDAPQTIDRLIDVFPAERQPLIVAQLASCLQAVIAQTLVLRADGAGRALACEVLVANAAVRSCIREHQNQQLISQMQLGVKDGMQTFDSSLAQLLRQKLITRDEAVRRARDPRNLPAA